MSPVEWISYPPRRALLLALLLAGLMLLGGGCGRNANRVPIDADGEAIDTVTELETDSTPTAGAEADAQAQAATATPAATDTAVPTSTAEPTATDAATDTPVPTETPAQSATEPPQAVAQAQSPLATSDTALAPTSPLPTPVANVSPLEAPAQPASPIIVPSVTALDEAVEDGVSYVRWARDFHHHRQRLVTHSCAAAGGRLLSRRGCSLRSGRIAGTRLEGGAQSEGKRTRPSPGSRDRVRPKTASGSCPTRSHRLRSRMRMAYSNSQISNLATI